MARPMSSLEKLPIELLVLIFDYCRDWKSIFACEQVCKRLRNAANCWYSYQSKLPLSCILPNDPPNTTTLYSLFPEPIDLHKLCYFLKHKAFKIKAIEFKNAPFFLTMSSMIQLASATPKLHTLDLRGLPEYFRDVDPTFVFALPYFRNLQVLRLEGDFPEAIVGRQCSHRSIIVPLSQLNLSEFTFNGPGAALSRILSNLRNEGETMNWLTVFQANLTSCDTTLANELTWLIEKHLLLEAIVISNTTFPSVDSLKTLYRSLSHLPRLSLFSLTNCQCRERISEGDLQFEAKNLQQRGVYVFEKIGITDI